MLILGVVLVVLGWFLGISIVETLGVILIIVGALLAILGGVGHPLGPRSHYW